MTIKDFSNRLKYYLTQAADNINVLQTYIDTYNANTNNSTLEDGKSVVLINSLQHKYNEIIKVIDNYENNRTSS